MTATVNQLTVDFSAQDTKPFNEQELQLAAAFVYDTAHVMAKRLGISFADAAAISEDVQDYFIYQIRKS